MIMKEMEYGTGKTEILAMGEISGFEYFVISYGTHPCCYIKIPEEHEYYKKDYDDIDIYCHGGLTYSKESLLDFEKGWFIGWDYAHLGDYHPLVEPTGTKYSVGMLIAEVTDVICNL